jgi:hypothetical protein
VCVCYGSLRLVTCARVGLYKQCEGVEIHGSFLFFSDFEWFRLLWSKMAVRGSADPCYHRLVRPATSPSLARLECATRHTLFHAKLASQKNLPCQKRERFSFLEGVAVLLSIENLA